MNGLAKTGLFVAGSWLLLRSLSTKSVTKKETVVTPVVATQPIPKSNTTTPTVQTAPVVTQNQTSAAQAAQDELNIFLPLQKGATGKEVTELQKQLGITASGTFDQATEDILYNKTLSNSTSLFQYSQIKDKPLVVPNGIQLIVTDFVTLKEVQKDVFGFKDIFNNSFNLTQPKTASIGSKYNKVGDYNSSYVVEVKPAFMSTNQQTKYYAIPTTKVKFR